jgi:hypothetical protein
MFKVESVIIRRSATLFNVVVDEILKQLNSTGNTSASLKQCSAYADDILITTRTKHSLTDALQKPKCQSVHFAVIVIEQKQNI